MKTIVEANKIMSSLFHLRLALSEAGITEYMPIYVDSNESVILNDRVTVNVNMDSVEATLRDVMRAIIKEEEKC